MPRLGVPGGKALEPYGHSVATIFAMRLVDCDVLVIRNAQAWAGQAENPPKPVWAFGWLR